MKPHVTHGLLRDWPLKLVSLVLAVALWLLLVPAEKTVTVKSLTIPLETLNVPAGLEIVEGPVATVDVTLRGPSRLLDGIGPSGLVARLDLERRVVVDLLLERRVLLDLLADQGAELQHRHLQELQRLAHLGRQHLLEALLLRLG